jgi:GTP-binding protein
MRFVDSCRVKVVAGDGGNGSIAFRREKYIPFGGPSGGDGGKGGDIIFAVDSGLSTLLDVQYAAIVRSEGGEHGQGSDCYGKGGKDNVVRVPAGTQIFDEETGKLIGDLTTVGDQMIVARGGKGGRGNIHFATPYDRAPRKAEPGEPGEKRTLRLELKVMADVGLLGFPNAGKSTFVAAVSRARPKVADYPFTTLTPHLGVVQVGEASSFVVADIPGLIPGASDGAGLGVQFLKHVERTRALLHLISIDPGEGREPYEDYLALRHELESFDPELAARPEVVALSKADLPEVQEAYPALRDRFAAEGKTLLLLSAATRRGLTECINTLWHTITSDEEGHPRAGLPRRKARAPHLDEDGQPLDQAFPEASPEASPDATAAHAGPDTAADAVTTADAADQGPDATDAHHDPDVSREG